MKLTRLSTEERRNSCLNCRNHFKAKGGVGLGLSSEHMCNKGRRVQETLHTNQNGHIRHLKETQTPAQTCEQASSGRGYCKDIKRKDCHARIMGIFATYGKFLKHMQDTKHV